MGVASNRVWRHLPILGDCRRFWPFGVKLEGDGLGHAIAKDVAIPKLVERRKGVGSHHSLDVAGAQDVAVPN